MKTGITRTRWAAIGAAVAVTLGAGGIGMSYATSPSGAAAFVPVTPCRVLDTRPAPDNTGNRATPIVAGETHTVSAHGDNGDCFGIPVSATGLALNVTTLGATAPTFVTVWATGATQPTASNLNPQPGQPPTPNAVTTGLSAGGQFNIFNAFGTVNVIVDVVGYYTDHQHDDRYYTEAEVDTAIETSEGKTLFATIAPADANAAIVRGAGAVSTARLSAGAFRVTFNRDITDCTWMATYGQPGNSVVNAAWATVRGQPAATDVLVVLRDDAGTQVDGNGFHIAVFCP